MMSFLKGCLCGVAMVLALSIVFGSIVVAKTAFEEWGLVGAIAAWVVIGCGLLTWKYEQQ